MNNYLTQDEQLFLKTIGIEFEVTDPDLLPDELWEQLHDAVTNYYTSACMDANEENRELDEKGRICEAILYKIV